MALPRRVISPCKPAGRAHCRQLLLQGLLVGTGFQQLLGELLGIERRRLFLQLEVADAHAQRLQPLLDSQALLFQPAQGIGRRLQRIAAERQRLFLLLPGCQRCLQAVFHDIGRRRFDLLGTLRAVGLDAVQFALRDRLLGEDILQLALGFAQRELRLAQGTVEIGIALALGTHGALGLVEPRLGAGDQDADPAQPIAHLGDLVVGRHVAFALGFLLFGQFGQLLLQALLLLAVALDGLRELEHLELHAHARVAGGR